AQPGLGDRARLAHVVAAEPIERFTLDTHDGPYETWPSRTDVLVNGEHARRLKPDKTGGFISLSH
ncbi:hypothetical protein C3L29_035725, partial [Pseudomonas sp. MWU12-2534b]